MKSPLSCALLGIMLLSACSSGRGVEAAGPAGAPLAGLSQAELARFAAGRTLFAKEYTPAEGLGPLFNERRCGSCHDLPTLGGTGVEMVTKATRFEAGHCDLLSAEGGDNIQRHATPLLEAAGIRHEDVPRDANAFTDLVPPALYGLGLVEAIPDADIVARERSGGGTVTGRAARTASGRVGRFGRKGEFATVAEFVEQAIRTEMGLTTPQHPAEETINGRPLPPGVDPAPDPEVPQATLDALTDYVRFLAPPARDVATGAARDSLAGGERTFAAIGCANCHVASMTTGRSVQPSIDRRVIHLYSDLLLHEMGPRLAGNCGAAAAPGVWRTAPLMGIHLRQSYLHDGRAPGIEGAIEQHDGEARRARAAFEGLDAPTRRLLVRFVRSL